MRQPDNGSVNCTIHEFAILRCFKPDAIARKNEEAKKTKHYLCKK